jgi:putative membrane protein
MRQIVGWSIVGLIAVIGVAVVLGYFVPQQGGGFYRPFFLFPFGWIGGIFLVLVIFWVARRIFWPWRRGGAHRYRYYTNNNTLESIIRERYARGEITKEQFDQLRRDLEHRSSDLH